MLATTMTENFDTFERKFLILEEISRAIAVSDNISTITNLMLDLAINYSRAKNGSLMLADEKGELSIFASRGIDFQFAKTHKVKIGEGIAGFVAKNRLPVLVEDIEKDERFRSLKKKHYETKSFISCPIVSKNKLIGVLNIHDKSDNTSFSEDEFILLRIIANQAAIALENAVLMNQLRAKALELKEINAKLIENDIAKTEFLTRVSHELRTPLNSIRGAIYYLKNTEKMSRSEQEEFYDIVSNESSNLMSIVENQLDFLRLDDETRIIKKSVINLKSLLDEALNSKPLKTIVSKKNIQLAVDAKENISDIVGDKIRVVQAFINLIEVLCGYLKKGDSIKIAVEENDSVTVKLQFSKNLLDFNLLSLFEYKYIFQSEQSSEILKLYLALKVIESHRWTLKAENINEYFLISIAMPKSSKQMTETVIQTTMEMFVDFFADVLDIDKCSIMLIDDFTGELHIKGAKGLDENVIKKTRLKFGDRIAGWVAVEGKPLLIEDIGSDPRFMKVNAPQYTTKSLISLPLKAGDKVIGVLNLNNKRDEQAFTMRDLYVASTISERISHFIESFHAGVFRDKDFKHFMSSFENLVSAGKKYLKKGYMIRDLTVKIMDDIEANEEDKKLSAYIAVIYDLGLAVINSNILNKSELSALDVRTLKTHPFTTVSLINNFEFSDDVKKAICHHHERYDGTGYPDGLKGEEIPLISRVIAVVDSYCAMISDRAYRKAFAETEALHEIKKGSGSLYDPRVVESLEKVLKFS